MRSNSKTERERERERKKESGNITLSTPGPMQII
jgi:hypothetical protein